MNKAQQAHLQRIHTQFLEEHAIKFAKGALEHKTQLHEDFDAKQLIEFAIEEVLDLASYLYTARELLK
jgi:hypothetical protein